MTLASDDTYDPVAGGSVSIKDDDPTQYSRYPPNVHPSQHLGPLLHPPPPQSQQYSGQHPLQHPMQVAPYSYDPQPMPQQAVGSHHGGQDDMMYHMQPQQYQDHMVQPMMSQHPPPHHGVHQTPLHPQQMQYHHHYSPPVDMSYPPGTNMMPMVPQSTHNEMNNSPSGGRKVAPRSSNLFRVGPPFSATCTHNKVYCSDTDLMVNPVVEARIDRGFEVGDNGTWIGYKRNYFTLVASFYFKELSFDQFANNRYYTVIKDKHGVERKVPLAYFAIRLVAKCSDDEVQISLIQHTAKRDKGPQFPPPIYPAVPGEIPDHETVKASCNKRNGSKIENMNRIFYFNRNEMPDEDRRQVLNNYPMDSIARVARFERIQFTSSIRIKSSQVNSRFFSLHVELLGVAEDDDLQLQPMVLSSIESPPLIIRGRSPSNYQKEPPFRAGLEY
ncbi:transcription factor Ndt80p [Diutina catenulata]